jgi:protein involved in polysaccharide export with SLBB domain
MAGQHDRPILARRRLLHPTLRAAVLVLLAGTPGCASLSNPVGDGIPASRVPDEYLAYPKSKLKMLPLTALRQPTPSEYRLAAGDIVGVYIEGVIGEKNQPIPVRYSEQGSLPPVIGYPVPVNAKGELPLPLVPPIPVNDLTLVEVTNALHKAYVEDRNIIQPGRERIYVSLVRPRNYRVQVVRQDSGQVAVSAGTLGPLSTLGAGSSAGAAAGSKRGIGVTLDLPAYENDVLNALNRTGGLPGLDALNEIVIERAGADGQVRVLRIPLRYPDGEEPKFDAKDIILENGDIVFIENRDAEVYYTGGVMLPSQQILPRDYDLRVVEALARSGGPLVNGLVSQNNLSGNVAQIGLGSYSPSRLSVVRRLNDNRQITILVDLNRALNDPDENIIVRAGDILILQETPGEAVSRYLSGIIQFDLAATLLRQRDATIISTVKGP